jgi:hypothetical protein
MTEHITITVIDVFRSLGLETDKRTTWAVGYKVRDLYTQRYGGLPPKELRTKTCGVGVHCFAVYPPEMRTDIEAIIRRHIGARENLSRLAALREAYTQRRLATA